jgi:hypothetical protein
MRHFHAHQLADAYHRVSELLSVGPLLHERAAAVFHIEHQSIKILRQLFAHDAGYDQWLRWHRAGYISQRVKFFVSRTNIGGLSDHEDMDLLQLFEGAGFIEIHVESRDAFELVQRASGNSKPATRNHRYPRLVACQ